MIGSPTLAIGYLRRVTGVRGEVAIRCFDPLSQVLHSVGRVMLILKDGTSRTFGVQSRRLASKEFVLKLEAVSSLTEAEPLVGAGVSVFRDDLSPPNEGEFFQGDLVGLSAFADTGEPLGEVKEIWNSGPVPNLVIRDSLGSELMVPFTDDFVPVVDLRQGRLVVRPLEYWE